jgi:hypothetical protein
MPDDSRMTPLPCVEGGPNGAANRPFITISRAEPMCHVLDLLR